jgi:hypothetical protein
MFRGGVTSGISGMSRFFEGSYKIIEIIFDLFFARAIQKSALTLIEGPVYTFVLKIPDNLLGL